MKTCTAILTEYLLRPPLLVCLDSARVAQLQRHCNKASAQSGRAESSLRLRLEISTAPRHAPFASLLRLTDASKGMRGRRVATLKHLDRLHQHRDLARALGNNAVGLIQLPLEDLDR